MASSSLISNGLLFGFKFHQKLYPKVSDLVGSQPQYKPPQNEVYIGRLLTYASRMQDGLWNWSGMQTHDVTGKLIQTPIEVGISPRGEQLLCDGVHRYLAALLTNTAIPSHALRYENIVEEPDLEWSAVDWMFIDPHGIYPVLSP